jgi:hypothetical protein
MGMQADYIKVSQTDVQQLADKLNALRDHLTEEETTVLVGVLSLAEHSLAPPGQPASSAPAASAASSAPAAEGASVAKKRLVLERETIRSLNVWDRLLQIEAHSLWTCNGAPRRPSEERKKTRGK